MPLLSVRGSEYQNADWQGASFIVDDYLDENNGDVNDIFYKWLLFDVVSDLKAAGTGALTVALEKDELASSGFTSLKPGDRNVSALIKAVHGSSTYEKYAFIRNDLDQSTVWAAVITDNSRRWLCKGAGAAQAEGSADH